MMTMTMKLTNLGRDAKREMEVETSRNRLVLDTFGKEQSWDNTLPPIENIIVLLWMFRDDLEVVQFLTQLVLKHVADQAHALVEQVAIYLPQITTTILNAGVDDLDSEGDIATRLEQFVLILAQQSTNFAVQYYWTLRTLMDMYQPMQTEQSGRSIGMFEEETYGHCMSLCGNLDRCMRGQKPSNKLLSRQQVAPKPTKVVKFHIVSSREDDLFHEESHEINQADWGLIQRTAADHAGRPASRSGNPRTGRNGGPAVFPLADSFGGVLWFKRDRRKPGRRKLWKQHFFAMEEGMLNCYDRYRQLLRSMPLEGAIMWKEQDHPHAFIVFNHAQSFHLRATSDEDFVLWSSKIKHVIQSFHSNGDSTAAGEFDGLTLAQRRREEDFQSGKWFGRTLLDVLGDLRNQPKSQEGETLLHDIFFDLEMRDNVYWPFAGFHGSNGFLTSSKVQMVLPRCARVVSNMNKKNNPHFLSSFLLDDNQQKEQQDTRVIRQEEERAPNNHLELPVALTDALEKGMLGSATKEKETECDSSTGESCSDNSGGESSEESFINMITLITMNGSVVKSVKETESESKMTSSVSQNGGEGSVEVDETAKKLFSCNNAASTAPEEELPFLIFDNDEFSVELEYNEKSSKNQPSRRHIGHLMTTSHGDRECLALQLISFYRSMFARANIGVWVQPMRFLRLGRTVGITEVPHGCIRVSKWKNLRLHMEHVHGSPESEPFQLAQQNFLQSLAGYLLISHLVGIKDNHLMLDKEGHLVISQNWCLRKLRIPSLRRSKAGDLPFAVPKNFEEVLGGSDSACFEEFKNVCLKGLMSAHENRNVSLGLQSIMSVAELGCPRLSHRT